MDLNEKGEPKEIAKKSKNPPINTPHWCTVFGLKKRENQPNYGQISPRKSDKENLSKNKKKIFQTQGFVLVKFGFEFESKNQEISSSRPIFFGLQPWVGEAARKVEI